MIFGLFDPLVILVALIGYALVLLTIALNDFDIDRLIFEDDNTNV